MNTIRKGENLASLLNERIDQMLESEDGRNRAGIVADMASAAGITSGTVNQILNGSINCPPLQRLDGFSEVLPVDLDDLISAAGRDGCEYEVENEGSTQRTITRFADLPLADSANEPLQWQWNTNAQNEVLSNNENPDWRRYRQAHIYYNPDEQQTKAGYKLPIAQMVDNELRVYWRGVTAAMGALLGARGGVDIPDSERRSAYNHLVRYYEKFERDAPEFRAFEGKTDKAFEGVVMLGREFTVKGSYERDMRDLQRSIEVFKPELFGMSMDDEQREHIVTIATFNNSVICYSNRHDTFYSIDWSRDANGMIELSNPQQVEIDFGEGMPIQPNTANTNDNDEDEQGIIELESFQSEYYASNKDVNIIQLEPFPKV